LRQRRTCWCLVLTSLVKAGVDWLNVRDRLLVALIIVLLVRIACLILIDDDRTVKLTLAIQLLILLLHTGGLRITRSASSADHHIHTNTTAKEQGQPHADLPENKHTVVATSFSFSIVTIEAGSFFFCYRVVIISIAIRHFLINNNN